MSSPVDTTADGDSWLGVIDDLIDEEIDREESVELTAEELQVDVPLRFGADSPRAEWRFDGAVRVSAEGTRGPLADWLRFWYDRTGSPGHADGGDADET